MKIVFIGSGNVATHLAKALHNAGQDIVQVFSRNMENARVLSSLFSANATDDIRQIIPNADIYIFSVKDDVLPELISQIPSNKGLWVHTAGTVPVDVFASYSQNYGVFYPLQTFSKERAIDFSAIPIFIEGCNNEVTSILEKLAKSISDNVRFLSSEKRRYTHLAAVFACNFVNHMYVLASEVLEQGDVPFHVLEPLIKETAAKIREMTPQEAQTGPAVRFDEKVISKHLELINDEATREIYNIISNSIYKHSL